MVDHAVSHLLAPLRYRDEGLVVDSVHVALDVPEVDGGLFQPEGLDGVTQTMPPLGRLEYPFVFVSLIVVHESLTILPGYLSLVERLFRWSSR